MVTASLTAVLGLLVSIQLVSAAPTWSDEHLKVKTSSGELQGIINGTTPGVRQFLGVPFAQPPVGELRWLPPVALPNNLTGTVVDATRFSLNCPQYESTSPSVYNKVVREYFIQGPSGEDCLTLSIWAPANPTHQKLPVFIWLYGGGLQTGGSSVPYQVPAQWVQRTQSHIVVSVQYRLNIFGFPNAEGLPAQNLGYYDQRLAVEWIQANIAAFGGDSKKMVLWGQSAGAGSTDAYNYAYPDDPIVTGIICDSGSAEQPNGGTDFGHTNFTSFAAHFNCSGATMLPCMRNVSATDIIDYLAEYQESGTLPAISFATIPDNVTVFSNYTERLIAGNYSKVPAIYGFNDIDGTTLIAMPAVWKSLVPSNSTLAIEATLPPPNNTAAIIEFTTSQHCPVVVTSDLRTQGGRVTYRYQYQGNFTNISPLVWMGAYHSGELPMIFGTDGDFRGPSTKFEKETSIKMQDLWLAFANDPEHGVEESGWANVTSGSVNAFGADNKTARLISAATLDAPCS